MNSVKIPSPIKELAAFEHLKNWLNKCCDQSSAFIFDWIFIILAGNNHNHKNVGEFNLKKNQP